MDVTCQIRDLRYRADLHQPVDISIPLVPDSPVPNAYHAPVFRAEPVRAGDFVGDTREGGSVNFMNVFLNPHGNGTHTECVGHISTERIAIHDCLRTFHFTARLITVLPERREDGDKVISEALLKDFLIGPETEALVIRTLPNLPGKESRTWSGTNPPYLEKAAVEHLVRLGLSHLLLDLPSVDREEDSGRLEGHKAWWRYPEAPRREATITEMIRVPDELPDGLYLLNLQIPSVVLDAGPSKPVLYPLTQIV